MLKKYNKIHKKGTAPLSNHQATALCAGKEYQKNKNMKVE
jgi:hypothetical protein